MREKRGVLALENARAQQLKALLEKNKNMEKEFHIKNTNNTNLQNNNKVNNDGKQ